MPEHLHDHYLSCTKDFLNIVSVTFIDKTEPSHSLQKEQYWRHILQTNATPALNIADGVSWSMFNLLNFHGIDF